METHIEFHAEKVRASVLVYFIVEFKIDDEEEGNEETWTERCPSYNKLTTGLYHNSH